MSDSDPRLRRSDRVSTFFEAAEEGHGLARAGASRAVELIAHTREAIAQSREAIAGSWALLRRVDRSVR